MWNSVLSNTDKKWLLLFSIPGCLLVGFVVGVSIGPLSDGRIQAVSSVFQAIAAVLTLGVAWKALNSWRDSMLGTRSFNQALDLLDKVRVTKMGFVSLTARVLTESKSLRSIQKKQPSYNIKKHAENFQHYREQLSVQQTNWNQIFRDLEILSIIEPCIKVEDLDKAIHEALGHVDFLTYTLSGDIEEPFFHLSFMTYIDEHNNEHEMIEALEISRAAADEKTENLLKALRSTLNPSHPDHQR